MDASVETTDEKQPPQAPACNGTEFGIRVSGLGERWFTAPAPMVDGLHLPGFSEADAAPDIGDSVITETAGLGGWPPRHMGERTAGRLGKNTNGLVTPNRQGISFALGRLPLHERPE